MSAFQLAQQAPKLGSISGSVPGSLSGVNAAPLAPQSLGGAAPHQLVLPHGLRGALAIYPQWLVLLILALLIVSLVAALVLMWRWWRRRRLNRPRAGIDPWDELLARVTALTPAQPFTKAAQEDFFAHLSLFLREGIERRTGLPATDRTYQELRVPLKDQSFLPKEQGEALLQFLQRADLVKFAASPSGDGEARAAASQVAAWITALRSVPGAAKAGEASHASS